MAPANAANPHHPPASATRRAPSGRVGAWRRPQLAAHREARL